MKAYVHLRTFDGRSKFSTWLIRIAINSALMTLRRKRVHPETPMEVGDGESRQRREIADPTEGVEDFYARCERAESLRRAICRLQPTLRNVIEIRQLNDRSVKEIADSQASLLPPLSLVCYALEPFYVELWAEKRVTFRVPDVYGQLSVWTCQPILALERSSCKVSFSETSGRFA
jgi:hypothetical protein